MTLHSGDTAPAFRVDPRKGEISFHDWADDAWSFFFSHPADFTPVGTTEMGRTAQLADQFAARNTKPLGLSTDTAAEHRKWIADVNDTQHTDLQFPIVADADLKIARRSEEHTSELQSLMRISYAVFCLKKKKTNTNE